MGHERDIGSSAMCIDSELKKNSAFALQPIAVLIILYFEILPLDVFYDVFFMSKISEKSHN